MQSKFTLAGSLNFLNLADLLQLLGSNSATGILRIVGKYSQHPGWIYVEKGNPVNAQNADLKGMEALNSLFGWTNGEFEFHEEPISVEKNIRKNRMQVILDGIRMLDDGLIETAGPVSFDTTDVESPQKVDDGPLVKGPLIDYMYVVDEEEFEKGEDIVIEGKHGSWIWVVLKGVIQIVKETAQGSVNILRIGDGAFLGSIASFLMGGNVRSATSVALEDVQLGVLDSQRLFVEFAKMSPDLRGLLISIDRRLKQITDRSVDIFLNRDDPQAAVLNKNVLIREGGNEERAFKITHGEAYVTHSTDSGIILLANLGKGDIVGNLPFINMGLEPESASVYISEDVGLSPLNPQTLREEFEQLSPTFRNIIENVATNISATSMVAEMYKKQKAGKSTNISS
jgi:CRP-like cAMP-binding protein